MIERHGEPASQGFPASPDSRKGTRNGFSLLEVLVAVALLAILVLMLASMTNQVGTIWQTVDGDTQKYSAGRTLLDFMARELRTACNPVPMPASARVLANCQFVANLPANNANATLIPAEALHPHALFWQAPIAQNTTLGTLAEIGYFVSWDTSLPGRASPHLCRFFVEPSNTANYLVYPATGNVAANWLSNLSTMAPANAPRYQGWLSDNVVALWVRCLDAAGVPITQTAARQTLANGYGFDSRQGFIDSAGQTHAAPALPPCVEIAFVVIDSRTAGRIAAPLVPLVTTPADFDQDAATPGSVLYFVNNLPAVIRAGAKIFSTRVFLTTGSQP